jgi:hypothetical protein
MKNVLLARAGSTFRQLASMEEGDQGMHEVGGDLMMRVRSLVGPD